MKIINEDAITRRTQWVEKIRGLNGDFDDGSVQIEGELSTEIKAQGTLVLVDHLDLVSLQFNLH